MKQPISAQSVMQTKAFAQVEGVWLGLVLTAGFLFCIFLPQSSWGSLVFLSVPFFVGWRLCQFRDKILDGAITFRRALAFCWYTFFYGSLLWAFLLFLYLYFLDNGRLLRTLNSILKFWSEMEGVTEQFVSQLRDGIVMVSQMTPLEITFSLFMQSIFWSVPASLLIALICKRKKR